MRIAILGASSQIARDLTISFANNSSDELVLFARTPLSVKRWLGRCAANQIDMKYMIFLLLLMINNSM